MKRSPIRSRSSTERRRLEAEADRLVQEASRLMWRGKCARCKCEGHVGHHIIGRANKQTRHQVLNVIYLCDPHHRQAHARPDAFMNWLKQYWYSIYEWHTVHKHLQPERVSAIHLKNTIAELKQFIKRMEDENAN